MLPQEAMPGKPSAEPFYLRAEACKRLANYVIDAIIYRVLVIIISLLIDNVFPDAYDDVTESYTGRRIADRLLWILLYVVYMSLMEGLLNGKSIGKIITGTRAVNLDGTRISMATAFGRGFSRAVPFCPFSALGTPCNPWQDDWTDTMVIDEKRPGFDNQVGD